MAFQPEVAPILDAMEGKGYTVFRDQSRPYNLNLVGIRTADRTADRFNDWVTAFYRFDDQWSFFAFPATTDPGLFYRLHPIGESLGTAVLKPGQYRGAYQVGRHKGYKAFQQVGAMTVYRDANRDERVDYGDRTETGVFGINIHRSHEQHGSIVVGKWSAGCQVIQDPVQFRFLMGLGDAAVAAHGNSFTYTLLEERDLDG